MCSRVDDSHIQASFDGMVEEDAIEYGACVRLQAERDIADAQNGQHAGKFGFDARDGIKRFDGRRL